MMNDHSTSQLGTAEPTVQSDQTINHKGNPKIEKFGVGPNWMQFAEEPELRRLAKLHIRIERKTAALQALTKERQTIMQRCIRRMRRLSGKDKSR
ncbi:hypothetical protein [Celeribacter naphthalenivorans]|uniref:hypothetical protein n=1 Tax=Celeribacter naphthalenivorans TaxID=1614694 RepID=UPI001CFBF91B|nr:hypothetical protein [Celeribacter naphthalenivorans]